MGHQVKRTGDDIPWYSKTKSESWRYVPRLDAPHLFWWCISGWNQGNIDHFLGRWAEHTLPPIWWPNKPHVHDASFTDGSGTGSQNSCFAILEMEKHGDVFKKEKWAVRQSGTPWYTDPIYLLSALECTIWMLNFDREKINKIMCLINTFLMTLMPNSHGKRTWTWIIRDNMWKSMTL